MVEYRIGCSGWSYKHWRGNFYPKALPASRWLEHYASCFDTVELNNTFYRLPSESAVRGWSGRSPPGFSFSVKVSRLITHYSRLRGVEEALQTFLDRIRPLGDRLGPLLYQTPPAFARDDARLSAFLSLLPPGLVHAFEFRNDSWWVDPVFDILREHGAAFCIYNMGEVSTPVVATCPDVYVRFHGPESSYASSYSEAALADWRRRLDSLSGGERAWVYFNNDVGGHAPRDALTLKRLVGPRR